ncbi:hypothetical protein [Ralstonia sp. UBA689]|nr:hypothetical protein [Ralstonia sp. UBA689]
MLARHCFGCPVSPNRAHRKMPGFQINAIKNAVDRRKKASIFNAEKEP